MISFVEEANIGYSQWSTTVIGSDTAGETQTSIPHVIVIDMGRSNQVVPLRAEDYPALAEIWDNEEDDDIFADVPPR